MFFKSLIVNRLDEEMRVKMEVWFFLVYIFLDIILIGLILFLVVKLRNVFFLRNWMNLSFNLFLICSLILEFCR